MLNVTVQETPSMVILREGPPNITP